MKNVLVYLSLTVLLSAFKILDNGTQDQFIKNLNLRKKSKTLKQIIEENKENGIKRKETIFDNPKLDFILNMDKILSTDISSEKVKESLETFEKYFIEKNDLQDVAADIEFLDKKMEKYLAYRIARKNKDPNAEKLMDSQRIVLTQEKKKEYLYSGPESKTCQDHIDFFDLDYECVEDPKFTSKMPIFRKKNFFIVKSNDQKYFMRTQNSISRYEHALYMSLKSDGIVLNLLEHKILDQRFVGIFRYEKNRGFLSQRISDLKGFNLYDRYRMVHEIARKAEKMLSKRNVRNRFFNINLSVYNILFTTKSRYSFKIVSLFAKYHPEIINTFVPENKDNNVPTNKRHQFVYIIGKIFFRLVLDIENNYKMQEEMQDFIEKVSDDPECIYFQVHTEILELIRSMLNINPLDRPSLFKIMRTLERVTNYNEFYLNRLGEKIYDNFNQIEVELEMEEFVVRNEIENDENQSNVDMLNHIHYAQRVKYDPLFNLDRINIGKYGEIMNELISMDYDLTNENNMVLDTRIEDKFSLNLLDLVVAGNQMWYDENPDLKDLIYIEIQRLRVGNVYNKDRRKYVEDQHNVEQILLHSAIYAIQLEYEKEEQEASEEKIDLYDLANEINASSIGLLVFLFSIIVMIFLSSLKNLHLFAFKDSYFDSQLQE